LLEGRNCPGNDAVLTLLTTNSFDMILWLILTLYALLLCQREHGVAKFCYPDKFQIDLVAHSFICAK